MCPILYDSPSVTSFFSKPEYALNQKVIGESLAPFKTISNIHAIPKISPILSIDPGLSVGY